MLNKKGEISGGTITTELFSVHTGILFILGVLFLIGLFVVYGFIDRDHYFEKRVVAHELALAINTIPLFDGVAYYHIITPHNYSATIASGQVRVGDEQSTESVPYFVDKHYSITAEKIQGDQYVIATQGNSIAIGTGNIPFNPYLLPCEAPPNHTPLSAITIDPGARAQEHTSSLARRIISFNPSRYTSSIRLDVNSTTRNYGPATVSLHLTNSSDITLRAYIPANAQLAQNAYLACTLLNSVTQTLTQRNIPLVGAAIIPVNPDAIAPDDARSALLRSPLFVHLEVDSTLDPSLTDNIPHLASAIHNGINRYGVSTIDT